jgi:hypothetical protein
MRLVIAVPFLLVLVIFVASNRAGTGLSVSRLGRHLLQRRTIADRDLAAIRRIDGDSALTPEARQ